MSSSETEGGFVDEAGFLMTPKIVDLLVSALEARVLNAVRKPFYMIGAILCLLFVLIFGAGIFLSNVNDTVGKMSSTVKSTDTIIKAVTSPEAQKRQQESIKQITEKLNCDQQTNLQRALDALAQRGLTQLVGVNIVQPNCRP